MTGFHSRTACATVLLVAGLACAWSAVWSDERRDQTAQARVDFRAQVRPILADRCVKCHGAGTREAGLRLDHRIGALRGGDSGKVIVAGKSNDSELFRRVSSTEESERMPPADGENEGLSPAEIELLKRWIDQGADWPDDGQSFRVPSDHWAYQPVRRFEPPAVADAGWSRNPIDRFVRVRLDEARVEASPDADRRTLIKRLHYDLIGLPPRPEEVDEFVHDVAPDACEKVIDRLLASPRFGERWGRHWLDKARYADSDGYEKDNPRPDAWRYRDWVIEAINSDLPFDRFTIEQLAGDLLPAATPEQRLATAFHRQTLTNTEGGVDQEQFRVEAVFDRVSTTGTVWLGLTVGCAQCHTHKYDQITQAEYYGLFAFFDNGDETTAEVPISDVAVAEYERAKAAHEARVAELQAMLAARRAELAPGVGAWEEGVQATLAAGSGQAVRFHQLEIESVEADGGVTFQRLEDGSYLVGGSNPDRVTYTIRARAGDVADITGLKLEVFADPSLPSNGPGRVAHGNFVLNELVVHVAGDAGFAGKRPITFAAATADFSQGGWPVAGAIDGQPQTGWAVAPQFGKDHEAVFLAREPVNSMGDSVWLEIVLKQDYGSQHTIGRFRLQARTGREPGEGLPEAVLAVLAVAPERRDAEQAATLLEFVASRDTHYAELQQQIAKLAKAAPQRPSMSVRVINQRTQNPRTTRLLRRGDFLQPADPVDPDTLAVLHEFSPRRSDAPPDRLDLALWLVDRDNPLTPRVAVNQIWGRLFGRGLVRTMNDFGVRGERPSHPELLDWLAADWVEGQGSRDKRQASSGSGPGPLTLDPRPSWSRKRLIRLIVTSAAYRQSSHHRPELADIDPQNTLLHRQNRFRVEAETIRDVCLAASGLLSQKIGGPSVFPPLPPDIAALSYAGNFKWTDSTGDDRYRRGMYTFFKRTAPHPNLTTFDCPDANTTAVERSTSNTPLMALATLNNIVFVEASQALAARLVEDEALTDAERLALAFRRCMARVPSDREQEAFQQLLDSARRWYREHSESAKQLVGEQAPPSTDSAEAAAWVIVCRTLMNMDEFITRE
ncbi:MAG TPA: PSD1 and planctomycete cytochrome C domain-containing protein [Planctomycetaceae bacterium]|nr:PSD1 and planctomycete cytochrome C domain-containing protein [Planctomycetaceae bacterium]